MKRFALPIITLLFMTGCGKILGDEVARVEVNKVSSPENIIEGESIVNLEEGDKISLWSDMDLSYEDGAELWWELEITRNGEPYEMAKIDPFDKDMTVNSKSTNINGLINTSFSGRNLRMTLMESGEFKFKSRLFSDGDPSIDVKKAHLVIKVHE